MKVASLPPLKTTLSALLLIGMGLSSLSAQENPAPAISFEAKSLFGNSDLETDKDGDQWPDGWGKAKTGSTWEVEEGNHFIRLTNTEPGVMVLMYQEIPIPEGVEAIEMTWKQRVTGLKKGKSPWFDARIMMEFADADRQKVKPAPRAPNVGKDTAGWEEKKTAFLVAPGAKMLQFMPCLFQVESGTYDLDNIVLKSTDPALLRKAAEEAAAKRAAENASKLASRQAKAAQILKEHGTLMPSGNFETSKSPKVVEEEGNRFLRLVSTEPGKMEMDYYMVDVPADAKALELTWKQRITGLKRGAQPWFDARIMLEWKDASGAKMPGSPSAPYSQKDTEGWVMKSTAFLVPEGAATLVMMPSLFQVKAGTFELDNLELKPTDPAPILAKKAEADRRKAAAYVAPETPDPSKWPKMLKVVGNRLHDTDGKEVWLQGVNIPSLEWSLTGEQVTKSVIVAVEEWKANVLRLPVKDEFWFGQKGQTDGGKAYRELVDQVITLATNRGAYVVLDLHRYRAPRKEYLDFWSDAAARYKDHPGVLFDLINEPHGISWEVWRDGGFVEEKKKEGDEDAFLTEDEKKHNKRGFVTPGMQAMLDTVRATGAKNIVVVGGLDYAYELDGIVQGFGLKDDSGNGIMYACHIYPWKSNWQKMLLDAAALHPILLGEVGADVKKMDFMPHERQEDAETWSPAILGLIQQHKLNWTAWCFHPSASPRMLLDWDYTPTPVWGQPAKEAMSGKQFPPPDRLR